ncbi:MAG TPA: hypothetical protein VFG86_13570, partial [Chloroflexota bacterium]|nr:hypothetical protein [Chloroflexota bacterium]
GAGERLARIINFGMTFEGNRWNDEADLYQAAEKAGVPRKQLEAALNDGRAEAALRQDNQDMHSLGLNFYALQVRSGDGKTTVILEHEFDGRKVEEAIDWLSGGKLRKHALPTIEAYAVQNAPLSSHELQRVFRSDAAKVKAALEPAVKSRKLVHKTLLGMDCWLPP